MSIQTNFINSIKDGAIASQRKHGVLASITIVQAILESAWGEVTYLVNIKIYLELKQIRFGKVKE